MKMLRTDPLTLTAAYAARSLSVVLGINAVVEIRIPIAVYLLGIHA